MSTAELARAHRERILAIGRRYGVENVRIFGSTARGEAGPESDLDILVDLEPGRSLLDLGGFLYEVEELVGCRVDVVTEPIPVAGTGEIAGSVRGQSIRFHTRLTRSHPAVESLVALLEALAGDQVQVIERP